MARDPLRGYPDPRSLVVALVVKRTSRDASNVEVRVRLLAGVLVDASMVKGTSRGSATPEVLVRIRVKALWPNPKWIRDPAVNRGMCGFDSHRPPWTEALGYRLQEALGRRSLFSVCSLKPVA